MYRGGQNRRCEPIEKAARLHSMEIKDHPASGSIPCDNSGYLFRYSLIHEDNTILANIYYPNSKWSQSVEIVEHKCATRFFFFVCPKCSRRARYLYLGKGQKRFMCRQCSNLNYSYQQQTRDTLWYFEKGRQFALDRFGYQFPSGTVPADFPNIKPPKPKRMRTKTYNRLLNHYRGYQKAYINAYNRELSDILRKCAKDGLIDLDIHLDYYNTY